MGSPTGISSEGCVPAPLALLDDSPTSVAAAGIPSSTTRLCLGAVPGLQKEQTYQTASSEQDQKPLDGLPGITASPPLPHSCPRLLGTTRASFGLWTL